MDDDNHSGIVYTGPLAVLVNRFTASASEIFTAAIQDYHRGLVVGSVTYGKGTVQELFNLNRIVPGTQDAGQLKLTVDKFYRVNGASTQLKGVTPDIVLPSSINPKEFGEETQQDTLAWNQIPPVSYRPLHLGIDAALPKLIRLHEERIARNPAWNLYLKGIQELVARRNEKSISLVMATRKRQRAQDDRARLVLINDWRKLKGLPPASNLENAYKLPTKISPTKSKPGAHSAPAGASGRPNGASAIVPDVLLREAAHIVADMAALGVGSLPHSMAKTAQG